MHFFSFQDQSTYNILYSTTTNSTIQKYPVQLNRPFSVMYPLNFQQKLLLTVISILSSQTMEMYGTLSNQPGPVRFKGQTTIGIPYQLNISKLDYKMEQRPQRRIRARGRTNRHAKARFASQTCLYIYLLAIILLQKQDYLSKYKIGHAIQIFRFIYEDQLRTWRRDFRMLEFISLNVC